MAEVRIGISGWTYPPRRGVFFPEHWPQKRGLEYASRQLNSIEINGTFHALQKPESFKAQAKGSTPAGAKLAGPRPRAAKPKRDLFVYFDNNVKVRAPFDAMKLAKRVSKRG
jgi:uncharacterized protein YecE (DUF72 family)